MNESTSERPCSHNTSHESSHGGRMVVVKSQEEGPPFWLLSFDPTSTRHNNLQSSMRPGTTVSLCKRSQTARVA